MIIEQVWRHFFGGDEHGHGHELNRTIAPKKK